MSGWHREEDGRLVRVPEQDSSPERRPSPEVHRSLRSTSSEARRSRRLARVAAARASAGLTSPEVALGDPAVPSSLEVACGKRELALVAVDSSPQSVVPHRRRRRSSGSPPSRSSSPAEDVEMEEELLANLREVEELRLAIAQRISSAPPGVPPEAGFFQLDAPVEDQSFDLSTLQNDSSELSGPPGTPPPLPQPIPGWMSRPSPSVPAGAELAVSRPRAHPVPFPSLPAGDVSGLPRFPHFGSLLGSIHRLVDGPPGPPPVDDQASSSGPAPPGVAPGLSPVRPEVILDSLQVASPGAVVPLAPEVLQLQQQVSALEQFLTGNMAVSPEALATQITHSVELEVKHAPSPCFSF